MTEKTTKNRIIHEAYIIMSTRTGRPYIDEDNTSYVFTSGSKAEEFSETHNSTVSEGPKYYILKDLMSQCYAEGAEKIILENEKRETIVLSGFNVVRNYYNNTLNRAIAHIKHTNKKSELIKLRDERFIVPSTIQETDDKISILYATVKKEGDSDFMYIAFSDLSEYAVWSGHVSGYKPLEISFGALWRIARHHGVIINPYGNQFKLKRKMMETIHNGE